MEGLQKAEISCDTKGMSVAGCVLKVRDFVVMVPKVGQKKLTTVVIVSPGVIPWFSYDHVAPHERDSLGYGSTVYVGLAVMVAEEVAVASAGLGV